MRIQSKLRQIRNLCEIDEVTDEIIEHLDELEKMLSEDFTNDQMTMSAQLSIYPLRQPSLSNTINKAMEVFLTYDLIINPGSMSTMISGTGEQLWAGLKKAFYAVALQGDVVMIVTLSNACPLPHVDDLT